MGRYEGPEARAIKVTILTERRKILVAEGFGVDPTAVELLRVAKHTISALRDAPLCDLAEDTEKSLTDLSDELAAAVASYEWELRHVQVVIRGTKTCSELCPWMTDIALAPEPPEKAACPYCKLFGNYLHTSEGGGLSRQPECASALTVNRGAKT